MAGGNFNCDAVTVFQAFENTLRTENAYCFSDGNKRVTREPENKFEIIRNKECGKKRTGNKLIFLPSSCVLDLDDLLTAPDEI